MTGRAAIAFVTGALIALGSGSLAEAAGSCSAARVDIRAAETGAAARQSFTVELADTPDKRAYGLMNRASLAPDAGMLFIYDYPESATFWMKNTLIGLDIIFADARGEVVSVQANAIPGDLTPLYGGEAIKFVLEINAGLAAASGIAAGSQLRHPAIGDAALWPCD
ncbi:DUF192 domain-containing protein [Pseudogemmobacter faecipullorum]|uniref:DUF192 domain-containing protein n=1 Tax=Pseudogemmobacter faecipullorum TaxID=2755041 RepID=A0ABS8CQ85_9RHOB|nr:DUF192 domain-containing protein [Pseudogemmobacter faecipullorum]MCB5411518.1 DUF192 domain-containing protein [Pseudogemmobacter faecipullorum]